MKLMKLLGIDVDIISLENLATGYMYKLEDTLNFDINDIINNNFFVNILSTLCRR